MSGNPTKPENDSDKYDNEEVPCTSCGTLLPRYALIDAGICDFCHSLEAEKSDLDIRSEGGR
jgi:hypothetical protein